MALTLTIENVDRLDNGESTQLKLDRHGAVIGRSPHSDWSLPDPKSYISSTHCEIDYRDGGYVLIDKSTNGTFVNDGSARLSGPHALKDGDVINIGHYRVVVNGAGVAGGGGASASPSGAMGQTAQAGWGGWGDAPSAAAAAPAAAASGWDAPAASAGWDAPAAPAAEPAPAPSPAAGWDAPAPASDGWAAAPAAASSGAWDASPGPAVATPAQAPDAWGAPAASASGWDAPAADAWTPAPASAPSAGWESAAAPAAPAPAPAAAPAPAWSSPSASDPGSAWGAAGAGPAKPAASGWDALAPARDAAAAEGPPGGFEGPSAPTSGRGALSQNWSPPRVDAPSAAPPPTAGPDVWGAMAASNTVDWGRGGFGADDGSPPLQVATPGSPPAAAAPGADAAWRAFLETSGVDPAAIKAEPAQAAASAGAMMKRLVAGLVVMMEARARAKAQLGAQSTTLELKGNNPIKFARSPERVLAQLLNPPERGFMGATDAVEDSFRDLQAHQMATLAAMQGALRSTLDRFSPDAIRKRAETRGLLAKILPSAKNAALWDAYEREFEGVAKGSDEAFMDVFAKAFKAAYEQAAAQMKAQGR